uniref:Uncharacterized protein n=1 Tax=Desertifilum tharense IPPAS B-1220 TaxID=1781255 RepID=A0ACD5GUK7_9CYAN
MDSRYKGRGYVQITGRLNYTDWSRRLGIDLVGSPQRAAEPPIAVPDFGGGDARRYLYRIQVERLHQRHAAQFSQRAAHC